MRVIKILLALPLLPILVLFGLSVIAFVLWLMLTGWLEEKLGLQE